MTRLPARFVEDRALRDAARAVLAEDVARLRGALEEEGIASRVSSGVTATIAGRVKTGAQDVLAEARAQAGDRKGVIAVLIGAVLLWLAREPILEWLRAPWADDEPAPDDPDNPAAPPSPCGT